MRHVWVDFGRKATCRMKSKGVKRGDDVSFAIQGAGRSCLPLQNRGFSTFIGQECSARGRSGDTAKIDYQSRKAECIMPLSNDDRLVRLQRLSKKADSMVPLPAHDRLATQHRLRKRLQGVFRLLSSDRLIGRRRRNRRRQLSN